MLSVKERLSAIRELNLNNHSKDSKLTLENLGSGGFLDLEGETFKVINISHYLDVKWNNFKKRKSDYWVTELELINLFSGESLFVEWEIDDELEVSKTLTEVTMREILHQGKALTRNVLDEIAEEEAGEVKCRGKTFHYIEDETWAALYYKSKNAEPIPVRMFEFESDDGTYLTIEAWEDGDDRPSREAFINTSVNAQTINVLQN